MLPLVLENADISPSRLWNKIIKGKSDFLFAAEAQHIEHEHDDEHDSSKTRNPDINYSYLVNSTLARRTLGRFLAHTQVAIKKCDSD